jgi:hypothetical protein
MTLLLQFIYNYVAPAMSWSGYQLVFPRDWPVKTAARPEELFRFWPIGRDSP